MRTLTPTLDAAQRAAAAIPFVQVKVYPTAGGVRRLTWTRLYTGSEPAYYHATAATGSGALVRVRSVAGAVFQWQRIPSPSAGSTWSTWTAGDQELAAVALAAIGDAVALFGVTPAGDLVLYESADDGATWSAPATVVAGVGAAAKLAAAWRSGTILGLFSTAGATVRAIVRASGIWGAPVDWATPATALSGLAVEFGGDYNLVVAGSDAAGERVWSVTFGAGIAQADGTWGSANVLHEAAAGAGVSFSYPTLCRPDVVRAFYRESYAGTGAYSRIFWSHQPNAASYVAARWREPVPLVVGAPLAAPAGVDHAYGLGATSSGASVYSSHPAGVWQAPLVALTGLDLSADLVRLLATEGPGVGAARVELDNSAGTYDNPGAGAIAGLTVGSEIAIAYGYTTASGDELPAGVAPTRYTVERLTHVVEGGRTRLVIEAEGMLAIVERWHSRRQHSFAALEKTVWGLLAYLFAKVGLDLTSLGASSAPMIGLMPAWSVGPSADGETRRRGDAETGGPSPRLPVPASPRQGLAGAGRAALSRLLDQVPEVLFFRGPVGYLKQLDASEASGYSFGPSAHPVAAAHYESGPPPVNRWQVFASGAYGEAFDWPSIGLVDDRLDIANERELTTAAEAANRADAAQRRQAIHTPAGVVDVRPFVGAELYDAVDVTEPRAGLNAAPRRILGLAWLYDRPKGTYQQRIYLGGM